MAIVRADVLHQTLERPLDDFDLQAGALNTAVAVATKPDAESDVYVTNVSMTRVHHPHCQFVQGRDVGPISVADIERLGLTYCAVCC
jgi:hypothetical protein